jgi:hypothetical protein
MPWIGPRGSGRLVGHYTQSAAGSAGRLLHVLEGVTFGEDEAQVERMRMRLAKDVSGWWRRGAAVWPLPA